MAAIKQAGKFLALARPMFEAAGYEVQSARLATIPFPDLLPECSAQAVTEFALALEAAAGEQGYTYVSLGPAAPDKPASYACIAPVLAATQNVFMTGFLTERGGRVSLPGARRCAEVIRRAADLSPDGFANLRFAALANVQPGAPFFPAAYHCGAAPAFALATESADLAVDAFEGASSLEDARCTLVTSVETHAAELESVGLRLAERFQVNFNGIDFTLAPFPSEALSIGAALERLGIPAVGRHGTLAAAAILTDTLDRAEFHRVGFNGLMLPVLEDAVLARRAAEGVLHVQDLLLYSAVCGTGLDTVPLPGNASEEQLYAVLLDLAALAQRLDKPLTARLMPIPGKKAGDFTGFDFAYFANSRILALNAEPLDGLLCGGESFSLQPRIR
jgi:uncharacterized protein (UPF0210 family)